MTPPSVLAELRELSEKATKGRLFVEPNEHEIRAHGSGKQITTAFAPHKGGNRAHADMLLYVAAVNALPAILTALEAAEVLASNSYEDDTQIDNGRTRIVAESKDIEALRASLARLGGEKEKSDG